MVSNLIVGETMLENFPGELRQPGSGDVEVDVLREQDKSGITDGERLDRPAEPVNLQLPGAAPYPVFTGLRSPASALSAARAISEA